MAIYVHDPLTKATHDAAEPADRGTSPKPRMTRRSPRPEAHPTVDSPCPWRPTRLRQVQRVLVRKPCRLVLTTHVCLHGHNINIGARRAVHATPPGDGVAPAPHMHASMDMVSVVGHAAPRATLVMRSRRSVDIASPAALWGARWGGREGM